jgi:hypothetical protein
MAEEKILVDRTFDQALVLARVGDPATLRDALAAMSVYGKKTQTIATSLLGFAITAYIGLLVYAAVVAMPVAAQVDLFFDGIGAMFVFLMFTLAVMIVMMARRPHKDMDPRVVEMAVRLQAQAPVLARAFQDIQELSAPPHPAA